MKFLRILGIVAGLTILIVLVRQVGLAEIGHSLTMLGWGYGVVIVYPLSWMLLNTQGWRMALHKTYGGIPLWRLAQVRQAGEAFNSILPSGYIGGEPLKAKLLSHWIPLREATSSVLIAKAAQSLGLVLFIGLGLTVGSQEEGLSIARHPKTFLALAILTLGIGIFIFLLAHRSFSRLGAWLHARTGHPWLKKQDEKFVALDDSIGAFYREGKMRFIASACWHGAGWIAGALEVAIIFHLIGHSVSWREAWFIGAAAQLASVIGLFSPAGIGLYEGGHYLAAAALGLPPTLGVSVALIRRVRDIFWSSVGLFIFWRLSKAQDSTPAR